MESSVILEVCKDFTQKSNSPENFISALPHLEASFTDCTKRLFDFSNDCPVHKSLPSTDGLPELIIEGLDREQIWEELELCNGPLLKYMVHDVAKILTGQDDVTLVRKPRKNWTKDERNNRRKDADDASDENKSEKEYGGSQDLFPDSQNVAAGESDSSDIESETNFDIDDLEVQYKKSARKSSRSTPEVKGFQGRTSVVDDTFFKLYEMERFLEMEDAKEERRRRREEAGGGDEGDEEDDEDDVESVDLFDGFSSDEESDDEENQEKSARDLFYSDYFENDDKKKPLKKKRVSFKEFDKDEDEDDDDDDDDESLDKMNKRDPHLSQSHDADSDEGQDDEDEEEEEEDSEGDDGADILRGTTEIKSTFEKRQEKLKQRIEQLEDANITQKPWQLTGEARATKRPENSLLQENLDFEVTSKPAPVVTEETTQELEDIIRQRVLDHAWDDVERKERHLEEPYEFKKRITLDQEKSKLSLAEIYEKEYLKQSEQLKEDEENPAHTEIKTMMDALFVKMDALSNFHFMPKPVLPEVKIVKNVPSISMEEVAPITATDSSLLAPEEVQEKSKLEVKGDSEKTASDRKQALRQKKKGQRARAQDKLKKQRTAEKLNPGMTNKYSVKGALQRLEQDSKLPSSKTTIIKDASREKTLKSSKSFFGRLQDEVTSEIRGKKMKRRLQQQTLSSKKLKL